MRMIFQRSRDTEDWSNAAKNSALHHKNKLCYKIYSNRKQLFESVIIFHCNTILIWIKLKLKDFQITWANILFKIEHGEHNKCLNEKC